MNCERKKRAKGDESAIPENSDIFKLRVKAPAGERLLRISLSICPCPMAFRVTTRGCLSMSKSRGEKMKERSVVKLREIRVLIKVRRRSSR